jgi:hypothetical protein
MKKNSILLTLFLIFGLSCVKDDVKYSQFFADKKITITERLTFLEKFNLIFKKGFVDFE